MEGKNSGINWMWLVSLVVGGLVLIVLLWYGAIFMRSYSRLRLSSEILNKNSAEVTTYIYESGLVEGAVGTETFQGMVLSEVGCLRLWNGAKIKCFELSDIVPALIYLKPDDGLGESLVKKLVDGGWVGEKSVSVTNEGEERAFVSDVNGVLIGDLMRLVKFGDIVRVTSDVDTGEVISVIMVFRGGLL